MDAIGTGVSRDFNAKVEAAQTMLSVDISFRGSEDDGTLYALIHNTDVLPAGLYHQIKRYGLTSPGTHNPQMAGTLNGSRKALTELIHTYGLSLHVVPFEPVSPR